MPGTHDELPLTGDDLDEWTAGLSEADAAIALVRAGLDGRAFRSWATRRDPMFLEWSSDRFTLGGSPGRFLRSPARELLSQPAHVISYIPGPLRLSVTGNVVPGDVVPRLLRAPRVASAVLPTVRPPGSLRRRPWRWPVRIGVHPGDADDLAEAIRKANLRWPGGGGTHRLPAGLVSVHDLGSVGAIDVAVLDVPLDEAVAAARDLRLLANAVVVLDHPTQPWPVLDAQLATLRATTGAVATALAPSPGRSTRELAAVLGSLITELSHARGFDVAATEAFGRTLLLAGERDTLVRSDLASSTGELARALREASRPRTRPRAAVPRFRAMPGMTGAAPPPRARPTWAEPPEPAFAPLDAAAFDLETLAEGAFHGEAHEASRIPEAVERLDEEIRQQEDVRYLNVRVGPKTGKNRLRRGPNHLSVFVGAQETGALHGPALDNRTLGFVSPELTTVRLTAVLVPLTPRGKPTRSEFDVPRMGRSEEARLTLHVPAETRGEVEARLLLLHWNRVVQTAMIRGSVGAPARLEDIVVVAPDLNDLESRMRFDAAFVVNHGSDDLPALIRHSNGNTWVEALPEIDKVTGRIRRTLLDAVSVKRTTRSYHENLRILLIKLALDGNGLFNELQDYLGKLSGNGEPKRIQIVTARAGRFLPLEFVYPRVAPADDAKLCERWKAGGTDCDGGCFTSDDDTSVVCPQVFWGMSKVIERQYVDATKLDGKMLLLADPRRAKRTELSTDAALFAASSKVAKADVTRTVGALGAGARHAVSWEDWVTSLAARESGLLVLMPHTTPDPQTLEIAGKVLRLERVEEQYVTGRKAGVKPIVLLMGCDTSGSDDDPAGFCTRFMQKQAGAVFSSLTMLHSTQAPALTQQLVTLLLDRTRKPTPVGELVAQFRRQALQDGLIAALAITAYGEADKKV